MTDGSSRAARPYRWFVAGAASWFLAWSIQGVVFTWLVIGRLQADAGVLGTVQTALTLPGPAIALLGGVLADRADRRTLLVIAHLGMAVLSLGLAVATTTATVSVPMLVAYALWGMWWTLWGAIVLGVISLIGIGLEPRRVRSIGYRLREDDLLFRRGIMFQRQVAVPYGRMQLVDITRGPVARALGLADLKFVTAAASTAVTVPGLPMEEADRLRDELVALAETRRAGL